MSVILFFFFFFFQAEDGIRDHCVTGVQTCALPSTARRCLPRPLQGTVMHRFPRKVGVRVSSRSSNLSCSRALAEQLLHFHRRNVADRVERSFPVLVPNAWIGALVQEYLNQLGGHVLLHYRAGCFCIVEE